MHRGAWPTPTEFDANAGDALVLDVAAEVLGAVRKAKTTAQKSLRADVSLVVVRGTGEHLAAVEAARTDIMEAGRIAELRTEPADELSAEVSARRRDRIRLTD